MTTPRDLSDYGAPYDDELPVENPAVEQSAAFYNRHAEDAVQHSRTSEKAVIDFLSITSVATVSAANVNCRMHLGTGGSTKPTVARTALGAYTITFASSYLDGLNESETVSLFKATGFVESLTVVGHVQATVSGSVISVQCFDMAGAAADYTLGTKVAIVVW